MDRGDELDIEDRLCAFDWCLAVGVPKEAASTSVRGVLYPRLSRGLGQAVIGPSDNRIRSRDQIKRKVCAFSVSPAAAVSCPEHFLALHCLPNQLFSV